ncbi:hypothetical protein K5X85_29230 [Streptomyces sp. A144]|uniref:hypothetical protein n=1 Tax=Streptomyces sp. A144 TaxID=2871487 RepID=UPI001CBD4787|nr:hypothetical protein [Streptomyces sp. A144]UAX56813.1 hypothetical protein K5X85_29230 [Streptomyces sp. A144]
MAERLSFTLTGRDELSRVLDGTADSADHLRLRLSGLTADADGNLRDLQGRFVTVADAQRRLTDTTTGTRDAFNRLSVETGRLGEQLKANLISLAPAAIPAAAGLASSAAALATQFGAAALSAGAYALALGPQIGKITEAAEAQTKYDDAVRKSGAGSQQALQAQQEYQQLLAEMPPATREAAVAVGLLKDNYEAWSDSLSGDVMAPFNKGVAITNALLPETTGLAKGAAGQFDRLVTLVGGAIATPGFDALNSKVTSFANDTMDNAVDELTIFLAKLQNGEYDGGPVSEFFDYAQDAGPLVWDTLENVAEALLHVLEAGSGVGIGMLEVINALSGIVSAVPPEAIATLLQLAIAVKAVKLAAAGGAAVSAGVAALGMQIGAMRVAASGAPGALAGTSAAIGTLSRTAKVAMAGTGLGLLVLTLGALSDSSAEPKPDVDALATSLTELGRSGQVSGEALQVYGSDLEGLADALAVLARPSNLDSTQQFLTSLIGMDSTPVKNAKEAFNGIDEALTNMVKGGKTKEASAALDMIIGKMKDQGFTADEVRDQLDGYKDALAGQALEQQLAAESMGLFGEQSQQVQAKLEEQRLSADGLRQSIQALNDVNRAGLGGMIGFEAAIDAASKAAAENAGVLQMQGGVLVLNTEKQRAAATALNDLAAKTDEAAGAARESGASWETVNGIYERGRQQLIANAMQMGLNRQEAKALADQILKTPDKTAKLKGDLEDLKDKLADAKERLRKAPSSKQTYIKGEIEDLKRKIRDAENRLKNVDGKTATAHVTVHYKSIFSQVGSAPATTADLLEQQANMFRAQGGPIRRAGGGPIPGYPGGGRLRGPGTPTSDSILLWGSDGEYMIRAAAVDYYGEQLFAAYNAKQLPPAGAAAASPGLPARAVTPAEQTTASGDRPSVTYNVYPRQSVISVEDLRLLQRQEEARQRVGRPR